MANAADLILHHNKDPMHPWQALSPANLKNKLQIIA